MTESLLYGIEPLDRESLKNLPIRLSENPDHITINEIIYEISQRLNTQYIAVFIKENGDFRKLSANREGIVEKIVDFSKLNVFLRSPSNNLNLGLPPWVVLSIPICIPQEQLGLLLLSSPSQSNFDARQVKMLRDITGILAYGLQIITLIDITQSLSKQMMVEKMLHRQQVATDIHNQPLQMLSHIMRQLQQNDVNDETKEVVESIRQVTRDLRSIIANLRPSALLRSPEWMVKQVVRDYNERYEGVSVEFDIDVGQDLLLTQEAKYALFNVLTEALNNACKHAEAMIICVSLYREKSSVRLLVSDDGKGMDMPVNLFGELLRAQSFGMMDMYWWASIAKGELIIKSNSPTGTVVSLILPM